MQAVAFPTREAVQAFLLEHTDYMIGAVHFIFDNVSAVAPNLQGFVVQTNTTVRDKRVLHLVMTEAVPTLLTLRRWQACFIVEFV